MKYPRRAPILLAVSLAACSGGSQPAGPTPPTTPPTTLAPVAVATPTATPRPTQTPSPQVSFTASTTNITAGQPVVFSWSVSNVQAVYFFNEKGKKKFLEAPEKYADPKVLPQLTPAR